MSRVPIDRPYLEGYTATTWEPGMPLYGRDQFSQYIFNYREDPEVAICTCPDAARWPAPLHASQDLSLTADELDKFIRETRRWRENHRGDAA